MALASCKKAVEKDPDISGYYVLQSALIAGEEIEGKTLAWREYELFLLLNADQSATFFDGSKLMEATYGKGKLETADGQTFTYTTEEASVTLETADATYRFALSNASSPDLQALKDLLALPPEVGYFPLESISRGGGTMDAENFADHYFVLLNDDGTGFFCNGVSLKELTWADGKLDIEEDDDFTYVLEGDTLKLDDGYSLRMSFYRSDEPAPDLDEIRMKLMPGYYLIKTMQSNGVTIDYDKMSMSKDKKPFAIFNEKYDGVIYMNSILINVRWTDEYVVVDEYGCPYELKEDTLTIELGSTILTLERSNDTPPDLDELMNIGDGEVYGKYELYAFDMGSGMIESEDVTLTLYADGTGIYGSNGVTSQRVVWSEEKITVGGVTYSYSFDEKGGIILDGKDGKFYFKVIGKAN